MRGIKNLKVNNKLGEGFYIPPLGNNKKELKNIVLHWEALALGHAFFTKSFMSLKMIQQFKWAQSCIYSCSLDKCLPFFWPFCNFFNGQHAHFYSYYSLSSPIASQSPIKLDKTFPSSIIGMYCTYHHNEWQLLPFLRKWWQFFRTLLYVFHTHICSHTLWHPHPNVHRLRGQK